MQEIKKTKNVRVTVLKLSTLLITLMIVVIGGLLEAGALISNLVEAHDTKEAQRNATAIASPTGQQALQTLGEVVVCLASDDVQTLLPYLPNDTFLDVPFLRDSYEYGNPPQISRKLFLENLVRFERTHPLRTASFLTALQEDLASKAVKLRVESDAVYLKNSSGHSYMKGGHAYMLWWDVRFTRQNQALLLTRIQKRADLIR